MLGISRPTRAHHLEAAERRLGQKATVTDNSDKHRIRTDAERAAIAERNNFLVLHGWYLEDGRWAHPNLPATHRVDAETAQRIQEDWDANT